MKKQKETILQHVTKLDSEDGSKWRKTEKDPSSTDLKMPFFLGLRKS